MGARRSPFFFTAALCAVSISATLFACTTDIGESHPAKSAACAACHMSDFESARGHLGKRPTTCGTCHTKAGWHPRKPYKHSWPLTGKHAKTDCFKCHNQKHPVFEDNPGECVDCHLEDFERSKFPGHEKFSKECDECHSTDGWKPTLEDHRPAKTPEPTPTSTPTPTSVPPTPTYPTPQPTQKPIPTAKPKPKPTPVPTNTTPPGPDPDTISGPSRRR